MLARLFIGLGFCALLTLAVAAPVTAQQADTTQADTTRADSARADSARTDTTQAAPARTADSDSLRTAPADTSVADTAAVPGQRGVAPGAGRSEAPAGAVTFSARDSLVITFDEADGDVGTLYGDAEVQHKEATLSAYAVSIYSEIDELRAVGPPSDTATVGRPEFQRGGGEAFTGSSLAFNLRTERGRVVGARTSVQDGLVLGEVVKVLEDSTLFIEDGSYTTCDCPPGVTPSYSMRSQRMKIEGKWVYTGPIQLYIFNIPMPLWLPFGFLPATEGRRSGPLAPQYGEDTRGFYLRGFGWYQIINDYMDAQVTGSIWTQGSYQITPRFRYNKRYRYDGNLEVSYLRQKQGDFVDPNNAEQRDVSVRWSHRQDINPTTDFNGSVNLSSDSYLRTVSQDYEDNVTNEINSNVTFRKRWPNGGRDLDLNLTQRQTLTTGAASLTLPDISFSQSSFQPFEREARGPGEETRWYEKIRTSYRGSLDNSYDFNPFTDQELIARGDTTEEGVPDPPDVTWYEALISPDDYRRATGEEGRFDFRATHDIPVSTSFQLDRLNLSVSPSFNYDETWFIETQRRDTEIIETETGPDTVEVERREPGFFAARSFNTSLSSSTEFFGTFPLRVGSFSGLRHRVSPRLSLSYTPDFNADFWGRTRTYTNAEGVEQRYDIVTGRLVNRSSERLGLSFSMGNDFETRRVTVDSTGREETQSLKLLDTDVSSGYNFAADSLRLDNIRVTMRSKFLEEFKPAFINSFSTDLGMTFSPYAYEDGRQVNRLIARDLNDWRLARLTSLSFTVTTDISGGDGDGRRSTGRDRRPGLGGDPGLGDPGLGDPASFGSDRRGQRGQFTEAYDFSIPWSLDLDFEYRLQNTGTFSTSATANVGFDFNLTPTWKITGNSGYDFKTGELAYTSLNIAKDLDCWQMSFSWVPFGPRQQYGFSLSVKSGKLSQLLRLDVPNSGIKDRFRGAVQQATGAGF